MDATIRTIRSIAVEFFFRLYKPVTSIVCIASIMLVALCIWLVTLSAWWWLLFAVVILWALLLAIFLTLAYIAVRIVRPAQTKEQKAMVRTFVDKIENLRDVTVTPKFIILFRVVRDAMRPSQNGYITTLSNEATSLKQDFIAIQKSFRP